MLKNKHAYFLLFIFIAGFVLITFKGLNTAQPGDENVYNYMGKLVNDGKIPYKDFFFAHPPLQIYLIALVFKIFGFSIISLKIIPLLSTLAIAFFVFKIAQKFGNMEAVLASLLFLFSYGVMFNSVFSFGIELAAVFLVMGVYFLLNKNNYLASGLFFGLAGITRILSLVPIAIILIFMFFSDRKGFFKLSSSFLAVLLLINGIFALAAGWGYFDFVYKYHTQKTFGAKENIKEYGDIIKLNGLLFFSAILFLFAKNKKQLFPFALASASYLIFLMFLKKIFGFYFLVIFPFLAIMGGWGIISLAKNLSKRWKMGIFIAFAMAFAWNTSSDAIFLHKIGFAGFERGQELADLIISKSGENTMLFGDESVVPLLALQTNKQIALDFVDTNNQVFLSGMQDLNKVLSKLKGRDLLFIARNKQGLSSFREVREFLNKDCELLSQFHDNIEGDYLAYKCG